LAGGNDPSALSDTPRSAVERGEEPVSVALAWTEVARAKRPNRRLASLESPAHTLPRGILAVALPKAFGAAA
jgi:hypothetical protein